MEKRALIFHLCYSPLRPLFLLPAPLSHPLYINTIMFALPSFFRNYIQYQHISRELYVCVAPSPLTYVVHLALNTKHTLPVKRASLRPFT